MPKNDNFVMDSLVLNALKRLMYTVVVEDSSDLTVEWTGPLSLGSPTSVFFLAYLEDDNSQFFKEHS